MKLIHPDFRGKTSRNTPDKMKTGRIHGDELPRPERATVAIFLRQPWIMGNCSEKHQGDHSRTAGNYWRYQPPNGRCCQQHLCGSCTLLVVESSIYPPERLKRSMASWGHLAGQAARLIMSKLTPARSWQPIARAFLFTVMS